MIYQRIKNACYEAIYAVIDELANGGYYKLRRDMNKMFEERQNETQASGVKLVALNLEEKVV